MPKLELGEHCHANWTKISKVLPLQHEMKDRANFGRPCGTLNIGMALVVVLYITTGLFGYLAYGEDVGASISYTIAPGSM